MSQKPRALKLAALFVFTLFNINAKGEYFENPNFAPCIAAAGAKWDNAQREIRTGTSELNNLNNKINSENSNVQTYSKIKSASEKTLQSDKDSFNRENDELLKQAKDNSDFEEIYLDFDKLKKGLEYPVPLLVQSLQNAIVLQNNLIELEIASVLEKIKKEHDIYKKEILELDLEKLKAIKLFKDNVKDEILAIKIFQSYISGQDEKALSYINETFDEIFISAKKLYLAYEDNLKAYSKGMGKMVLKKTTMQMTLQVRKNKVLLISQKIKDLESSISLASVEINSSESRITGFRGEINTVNAKINRFQAESSEAHRDINENGCRIRYPGTNRPTPRDRDK